MNEQNEQLIHVLKALAEPQRLRLLKLCVSAECAVSELQQVLRISQPRVSQHLRTLCEVGLLEKFRDGHFVYYRGVERGRDAQLRRRLMELVIDEEVFANDLRSLQVIRSGARGNSEVTSTDLDDRALYRQLIDLTVTAPLGDLLDIGCGRGDVLKLLASRAHRAVGVDIDSDARRMARAELLTAGISNCTLRQGDMYALPFADREFDTVILDDVLTAAARPVDVLREGRRLLRPNGRLIILTKAKQERETSKQLAGWCTEATLRLAPPKPIPSVNPEWLLATATQATNSNLAA